MDQKQIIVVVILAPFFILLLFFTSFLYSQPILSESEEARKSAANTLVIGRNAINVPGHTPGSAIYIAYALFSRNGFVVIHEDADGKPGKIIGATALLESGANIDIIAPLLRSSRVGEALYAMLHEDNGDGWFDSADDPPIKDDSGNVVLMKFGITESSDVTGIINL